MLRSTPPTPEPLRLFVYGSLLSGEINHHMLAGARFAFEALTVPAFELCDLGPYPALVRGGKTRVRGEVYLVSVELIPVLDEFEGHPQLYRRAEITLEGRGAAFTYLYPRRRARGLSRVASGSLCARLRGAVRA